MSEIKVGDKVKILRVISSHRNDIGTVTSITDFTIGVTFPTSGNELMYDIAELEAQPVASEPVQREEVYGDMTPAEIAEYQAQQDSLYEANEARQAVRNEQSIDPAENNAAFWIEKIIAEKTEALRKELDEARAANVALVAENRLLKEARGQQNAQVRAAKKMINSVLNGCTISGAGEVTLEKALEALIISK